MLISAHAISLLSEPETNEKMKKERYDLSLFLSSSITASALNSSYREYEINWEIRR